MIYDFDDAIWMSGVSKGNRRLAFMKNANKTKTIIGLSDLVFAGNQFLANYALQFNKNVVIIPTTIDTEVYKPVARTIKEKICIGWSGSITTIEHMETKMQPLRAIKNKYGDKVYFKIIGDARYSNYDLETQGFPWKKDTEVQDMSEFDIGIMPLPDDIWEKGKCGMKGLQYMGLGIPALMSPVGANLEIIQDGTNGYLPGTDEEWMQRLSLLIENASLRERIGEAGRKTVEDRYSTNAWKEQYLANFNKLTAKQ